MGKKKEAKKFIKKKQKNVNTLGKPILSRNQLIGFFFFFFFSVKGYLRYLLITILRKFRYRFHEKYKKLSKN